MITLAAPWRQTIMGQKSNKEEIKKKVVGHYILQECGGEIKKF